MSRVLRPKQAADYLGISVPTLVANTTPKGAIPGFPVGKSYRYRREALERYIAQHEQSAATVGG